MQKFKSILFCATMICANALAETSSKIFEEARAGNTKAIKQRIENSEDLSKTDTDGNTVLHVAAEQGYTEIVDELTTEPDYSSWGNWFYGCFWEVKLPNKNAKNKRGKTALHNAIENNQINAAEKLIIKKADTTITDDEGLTAIFATVNKDNPNFLPLFLKYKLIEQTINSENMLHYSIRNKKLTMVANLAQNKNLVHQENGRGYTPTMLAATQSDTTTLKLLKENGVALNLSNRFGQQPIHATAYAPSTDTAKYLLENGAFVDATDNDGNTPLLHSVIAGNKTGMDFFLAYKADAKKTNLVGKGVITLAVENKRHEILKRLKDNPDVNINERDNEGRTAFMNATITRNHGMMKDLIECGADVTLTDNKGENPFHKVALMGNLDGFAILIKNNSDLLDKVNIDGESPLFGAVKNGHLKMVKTLIYHNVSLQRSNKNGETIFHRAAQCKNKEVLAEIMNNNLTKANITQQAQNGLPAIHYAAANNNIETMHEFTKHGASYTDCDKNGNTLAHTAAFYGSTDVVRHFKKQMPMMFEHRNKDNHTPFLVAAKQGNIDALNAAYNEKDMICGDVDIAINLARQNGHSTIVTGLKEAKDKLMDECVMIHQQPQNIKNGLERHKKWHGKIIEKDFSHALEYMFQQPLSPQCYSVNDLLNKTAAERAAIHRENTKILDQVLQEEKRLEQKYNALIFAEAAEHIRKEAERIAEQERIKLEQLKKTLAEQQRKEEAERKRFAAEQEAELKKLNEQNAAIKELNEQNAELKKIKEQKEELDRIAKEKKAADAQKSQNDTIAAQKAELDHYAEQKKKADAEKARQQKHTAALEQQQEYVPMNLQPSAPPMEVQIQCAVCHGKPSVKPLPCKKCKTKCPDICNTCFKQYGGQCPKCHSLQTTDIEKPKYDCCLCTEGKELTTIPCENCNKESSSDRICKSCLREYVDYNKKNNRPQKCPRCPEGKLIESLLEKIISQQ